jgi:hypothetical protein
MGRKLTYSTAFATGSNGREAASEKNAELISCASL